MSEDKKTTMSGSDKETLRITMSGYGSDKMRDSAIYTATESVGPEMKILRDELKRQANRMAYQSGYEDQVIWAINSLENMLVKYNYEVRTTLHKDWRHKKTPHALTPAEIYERKLKKGMEENE